MSSFYSIPGPSGTIQIGTVTKGAPQSEPVVTNSGTPEAAVLNFSIPQGESGIVSAAEDGTAAAPGIAFAAETGLGVYRPGAGQLALSTSGTGRLFVDASGNVGIGDPTPTSELEILSAHPFIYLNATDSINGETGINFRVNGTERGKFYWKGTGESGFVAGVAGNSYYHTWTLNGSERLRITSAGLVGIGTSSPGSQLTVQVNSTSFGVGGFKLQTAGSNESFLTFGVSSTLGAAYITSSENGAGTNLPIYFNTGSGPSTAMCIDTSQRVGIGTTSPGQLLHLQGSTPALQFEPAADSQNSLIIFRNAADSATKGLIYYNHSNDSLNFTTNGTTTDASIDSSGRLGIGTSTPGGLLHLNRDDSNDAKFIIENDDGQFSIIANNNTAKYQSSEHIFLSASGATEKARLDVSGRLLVGTSSSTGNTRLNHKLAVVATSAVAGGARLTQYAGASSTSAPLLELCKSRGSSDGSFTSVVNGDTLGYILWHGADGTDNESQAGSIACQVDGTPGANDMPGRLVFATTADGASSPTERMRIDNKGKISTFASAEFNCVIRNSAVAGTTYAFLYGLHSSTGTVTGGTNSFTVWNNGNVLNTNNSYAGISDIKLKENIVDASSQWDDIKALRPVNYNFKEGQTHTQIGLIAQEVELVSPGLVSESPDRDEDGNDLGTVTKSVNYSVLYMKAVKALQEAMERIETLEAKVAALEST